jgi:8-oxo-dGTP pyrophosphatase MutT (NUDIX family)
MIEETFGTYIFDVTGKMLICRPYGIKTKDNWSIPKGKAEGIESNLEAAIREAYEETGLVLEPYRKKMEYIGTKKYRSGKKRLHGFVLYIETEINVKSLKCDPKITGRKLPEIDLYEMVWVQKGLDRIHESQSRLLSEYIGEKRYATE